MTPATWCVRPLPLPEPAFTRSPAFREVAEGSADMIAVLDAAGRRLYANPAFERLLSRADFISGSDSFGHVHPRDRSRVRKLFMRVLTDRQGRSARYRIIDRRGTVRHIESRSHVVAGEAGQAPRVMVISWELEPVVQQAANDARLRLGALA